MYLIHFRCASDRFRQALCSISIYTVDSAFFQAIGRCDALGLVHFYSRSKGKWSGMKRI
jgi:hypothetical protein